jgi:hypothetical protein
MTAALAALCAAIAAFSLGRLAGLGESDTDAGDQLEAVTRAEA